MGEDDASGGWQRCLASNRAYGERSLMPFWHNAAWNHPLSQGFAPGGDEEGPQAAFSRALDPRKFAALGFNDSAVSKRCWASCADEAEWHRKAVPWPA